MGGSSTAGSSRSSGRSTWISNSPTFGSGFASSASATGRRARVAFNLPCRTRRLPAGRYGPCPLLLLLVTSCSWPRAPSVTTRRTAPVRRTPSPPPPRRTRDDDAAGPGGPLRVKLTPSGGRAPVAGAPRVHSERARPAVHRRAGRPHPRGGARAARPEAVPRHHEQVRAGGEQGLLSVAFAPDYEESRLFYVDYTDVNGDTRRRVRDTALETRRAAAGAPLRRSALRKPQRRAARLRPERPALRRYGRRRLRRRPRGSRAES